METHDRLRADETKIYPLALSDVGDVSNRTLDSGMVRADSDGTEPARRTASQPFEIGAHVFPILLARFSKGISARYHKRLFSMVRSEVKMPSIMVRFFRNPEALFWMNKNLAASCVN